MDVQALFSQPLRLSPAELQADALLSLENRERYRIQSANTSVNALAALPPRGDTECAWEAMALPA